MRGDVDLSTSAMAFKLASLGDTVTCALCRDTLRARIKELAFEWSAVKVSSEIDPFRALILSSLFFFTDDNIARMNESHCSIYFIHGQVFDDIYSQVLNTTHFHLTTLTTHDHPKPLASLHINTSQIVLAQHYYLNPNSLSSSLSISP